MLFFFLEFIRHFGSAIFNFKSYFKSVIVDPKLPWKEFYSQTQGNTQNSLKIEF